VHQPADHWPIPNDGLQGEAALGLQISTELIDDPILRGRQLDDRRLDHALLAQHRQPTFECGPISGLDGLPRSSVAKVSVQHSLIEICQRAPAARDPVQETADHIEASPRAETDKPPCNEALGISFDEPPMRTALEASK
jgi:hypothetical protein